MKVAPGAVLLQRVHRRHVGGGRGAALQRDLPKLQDSELQIALVERDLALVHRTALDGDHLDRNLDRLDLAHRDLGEDEFAGGLHGHLALGGRHGSHGGRVRRLARRDGEDAGHGGQPEGADGAGTFESAFHHSESPFEEGSGFLQRGGQERVPPGALQGQKKAAVAGGRDAGREDARVAVDLHGPAESAELEPGGGIPRHEPEEPGAGGEQERVPRPPVFVLVSQHHGQALRIETEQVAGEHDDRTQESHDGGTEVRRDPNVDVGHASRVPAGAAAVQAGGARHQEQETDRGGPPEQGREPRTGHHPRPGFGRDRRPGVGVGHHERIEVQEELAGRRASVVRRGDRAAGRRGRHERRRQERGAEPYEAGGPANGVQRRLDEQRGARDERRDGEGVEHQGEAHAPSPSFSDASS